MKKYKIIFEDVFSFAIAERITELSEDQHSKAIQAMKENKMVINRFNQQQGIREQLKIKSIQPINN